MAFLKSLLSDSRHLYDRKGRRFLLSVSLNETTAYHLRLSYKGRWVGYAYCSFDEGVMCLNDIKVQDDVILPPQNLLYAFWRIAVKPKPVDLRNHGLGTAVLQNVIDEARARDAKYITGFVTPDDLKNTPRLLAWYSKHGFIILEQSNEIEGKWRKIILPLQLDNNVRNMLSQ